MNNTDQLPAIGPLSPGFWEIIILLAAVALVSIGVLLWIIFFRKKQERPNYKYPESKSGRKERQDRTRVRKRFRHRRREHRPMNPTLAQTGGLPPARPPEPPQSEMP